MTDETRAFPETDDREVVEPTRTELEGHDPVTTRNTDPAAMSETERNRRLTEDYEPPLNEQL
jgi:hypothetical protein